MRATTNKPGYILIIDPYTTNDGHYEKLVHIKKLIQSQVSNGCGSADCPHIQN